MDGNLPLLPPWDDLREFRAGRNRFRDGRLLFRERRAFLLAHMPLIEELATGEIEPAWVGALMWDELARRDITERLSDWLLGKLGRDPSVGPFQVTGATAASAVGFAAGQAWADQVSQASLPMLRAHLMDTAFATRVVVARCAQILATWRAAGFDPTGPAGLGEARVTALPLIGTLYSQGLGSPKAEPRANARGMQIAEFAGQLADVWCFEVRRA